MTFGPNPTDSTSNKAANIKVIKMRSRDLVDITIINYNLFTTVFSLRYSQFRVTAQKSLKQDDAVAPCARQYSYNFKNNYNNSKLYMPCSAEVHFSHHRQRSLNKTLFRALKFLIVCKFIRIFYLL